MKGTKVDKALIAAFMQLADKPKEVQKALKQYNLSAYDKDGRLLDVLPTTKAGGFWDLQTLPDSSGLTSPPPIVDAQIIFFIIS